MTLLEVQGLTTHFRTRSGLVEAVDGVSFSLTSGRTLGIVGESGCGKSVTALSILRLLPSHTAQVVAGRVQFNGRDLVTLPDRELEDVRGREIGMIFQDPLTSLNPTLTIGTHLVQTLRRHLPLGRRAATNRAVELLSEVRISNAGRRLGEYPHHLSGGMRQRVMIALAIACKPKLLIADEPTTALDVTVQAQILDLLGDLRREHEMAMIMITHDMGVIAETADDVAVMYAGQIVESAPVVELFERPEHPYTEALLGSLPKIEDAGIRHGRLVAIAGSPPELVSPPTGCRFAPRCRYAELYDGCRDEPQTLREIRPGHSVRTSHPRSQREIHLDVRTARFKNF